MASAHGEPSTSREEFNHDVEEMATDLESESDDDDDIQPNTQRKYQGAAVYCSRYDSSWKARYPCIQAVKGDLYAFYCTVCCKKVSCKHMGIGDVKRHMQGRNHQKASKNMEKQTKLSLVPKRDPVKRKVCMNVIYRCILCYI